MVVIIYELVYIFELKNICGPGPRMICEEYPKMWKRIFQSTILISVAKHVIHQDQSDPSSLPFARQNNAFPNLAGCTIDLFGASILKRIGVLPNSLQSILQSRNNLIHSSHEKQMPGCKGPGSNTIAAGVARYQLAGSGYGVHSERKYSDVTDFRLISALLTGSSSDITVL